MTDDNVVVNIKDFRPHMSGMAVCVSCQHKWSAVVACEDDDGSLKCPECNLLTGRWYGGYSLPEGTPVFVCACGNDYFEICDAGAFCPACNQVHDWITLQD